MIHTVDCRVYFKGTVYQHGNSMLLARLAILPHLGYNLLRRPMADHTSKVQQQQQESDGTRIISSTDMEVTIHPPPDTRMADHVVACTNNTIINASLRAATSSDVL